MRDRHDFQFEIKSINDTAGVFEGLCSTYKNVDRTGDRVLPGAFTKCLKETGGRLPLMLNHQEVIGAAQVSDSNLGLKVAGTLNLAKQIAQDTYSDLLFFKKHNVEVGMSFQFKTVKSDYDSDGVRNLRELQIFEASIATIPANASATVDLGTLKSHRERSVLDVALLEEKFAELRRLIAKYSR